MRQNPRHFAILSIAVLAAGSLLALVMAVRSLDPRAEAPEPNQAAFGTGPDLDGDGRPDLVRHAADPARLIVTSASGSDLLVYEQPLLPGYRVINLGGEYPALFVETARGEHAAFAYDPGTGLLQLLTWPDGSMRGYGELTPDGALKQTVVGGTARPRVMRLALNHLRLEDAGTAFQPLSASLPTPAEALTAAVEAVTLGLEDELSVHFASAGEARQFHAAWHAKLPRNGTVRVAQADRVNAGAEHGHRVPVTVWVTGKDEVAGLSGEAEFASGPSGVQIRRIKLVPMALAVSSWAEAARRVGGAARPSAVPFLGLFRFERGAERWAVDAVTGKAAKE